MDALMTDSVSDLRNEIKLLRGIIDGNYPKDVSWLMRKLDAQRKVLNRIHSEAYEARQARRAKALEEKSVSV